MIFYDSYEIMIRDEEHLHNVFFFDFFLILTRFDVCFCVDSFYFLLTQFSLRISRNMILSENSVI